MRCCKRHDGVSLSRASPWRPTHAGCRPVGLLLSAVRLPRSHGWVRSCVGTRRGQCSFRAETYSGAAGFPTPLPAHLGTMDDILSWSDDGRDTSSPGDMLAFAALGGNLALCQELLAADGGDPCANGAAALHWACERGHSPVVRRLLDDARLDKAVGGRACGSVVSGGRSWPWKAQGLAEMSRCR